MTIDNRADALTCLKQLLGRWEGTGRGGHPAAEPFDYREVFTVSPGSGPSMLRYVQRTWRLTPKGETPSHHETGFINVADSGVVEVMNAQRPDRVEVMHGRIDRNGSSWRLGLGSVLHAHDASERTTSRTIIVARGRLRYEMCVATDAAGPAPHLSARLTLRED